MERNRERRLVLEASLQEAFEDHLRVALIQPVDLRYSRMRGSGKALHAHGTSEVGPRRSYVLCIAVVVVQRIFYGDNAADHKSGRIAERYATIKR